MKRIRQLIIHSACIAALIDVGACSSNDGGASSEVQATGEGHDLHFFQKFHHVKKRKHHFDDCDDDAGVSEDAGARMCQNLALHVDSLEQRQDMQKADGTINVRVPESLSAYLWGRRLQAQLTLQSGDKRVVCSYSAHRHAFGGFTSSLELDRCDNSASAGDSIAIDSATLELECSGLIPFAKVWVDLPEVEPCGGTPTTQCDPATLDDHNQCTRDSCNANGEPQHEPMPSGTSCADDTVCNGAETCDAQGVCQKGDAPTPPQASSCQTPVCDAQGGWTLVPKPAGTSCADDNLCNGTERCTANGMCGDGSPVDADDQNPCTTDACDGMTGVTHVPVDSDDQNMCTIDSCNPLTGVVHMVVNDDDLNACTTDSCDPMTGVAHTPVNIDDSQECTVDACDAITGAITHINKPNGTPCSDGPGERACMEGVCGLIPM